MTPNAFVRVDLLVALANHVWQSTLCVGAAALVAWTLRRHAAKLRYRIWLLTAIKFLIPFSLLAALGAWLPLPISAPRPAEPFAVQVVVTPFDANVRQEPIAQDPSSGIALPVLLAGWGIGLAVVASRRLIQRRQLHALAKKAEPLTTGPEIDALDRARVALGMRMPIEIRSSAEPLAPGVIGTFRPIVLWPAGLSASLTGAELDTIFVHELSHVRRADNLIAALYGFVQAALWFNPAVWWLGARLLRERERACDEAVLEAGAKPRSYAAGLLKVCNFCLQSSFGWAAGATGSDLTRRVEAIMAGRTERSLGLGKRMLLLTTLLALVILPISMGVLARAAQDSQLPLPEGAARVTRLDVMLLTPVTTPVSEAAELPSAALNPRQATSQNVAPVSNESSDTPPSLPVAPSAPSLVRVAEEVQGPVRVGGDIREPKKIRDVKPAYPEQAKANGVQGIVILEAVIDVDGRVADLKVLRGQPLLNEAAMDAVSQWEFTPTTLNGQPVQVLMTVTVNFTLQ